MTENRSEKAWTGASWGNPFGKLGRTTVLAIIFIFQIILTSVLVPGYFSVWGLLDATRAFVEVGFISLAMTLIIITGGIDLSVGALLALVSVTIGFSYQAGLPLGAASLLGVIVGVAGGTLNGLVTTYFRLHPLVVTLGTFALFRGIAFAVSDADAVSNFPQWFSVFGQYKFGGMVPAQLVVLVICAVIFWLLLSKTPFGRYVYAIGHNATASRFSGVATQKVTVAVYAIMGLMVGLAGLVHTSRIFSARGNAGFGLELVAIAIVVLGGARILGGSGTIWGTVMGLLILSYLQDGLSFAGVRGDIGLTIIGCALILGVFLNENIQKFRK
ncbi:MAG: ABC transporter permease [Albidovulum sp.]|nr:ABC transporter permease [Albidovulum sp.]